MVDCCSFVVQNGYNTPFWEARWRGGFILKEVFPELYNVSCLKGVSGVAMGGRLDGRWCWSDFGLSAALAVDPRLMAGFISMREMLESFSGLLEGRDLVTWDFKSGLEFSVASCYKFYGDAFIPYGPHYKFDDAFRLVWKAEVPFKIKAFGWRLLLDRLPTKDLLEYRGISFFLANLKCSFCGIDVESRNHSIFGCWVVKSIWREIAVWVDKMNSLEDECLPNFMD
ncbi:uncharacterized protein LOC131649752 [Vicia villosa]|uniref:uncharacterized protein LOC131649752 n=1 Tax=Vicia villosa TaxID=3911 RepID=UPI00273CE1EF|nr:uncharacterized protein LOC131649752 [Vicia villosa]